MTHSKKSVSVLLLALMLAGAVTACGETAETPSDTQTEPVSAQNTEESDTADHNLDHIPEADFGGYEFRYLNFNMDTSFGWLHSSDLISDGETGDGFNDAVYRRNAAIAEKYNCSFTLEYMNYRDVVGTVQRFVQADEDAYDVVFARLYEAPTMIYNQSLLDLNDLDVVDFSMPWWDQNSVKNLSIGGRLYLVAGDITTMDKDCTYCMLFNKQLAAENDIPDLYNEVKNGNWTFDKVLSLQKGITRDMNGDDKMGKEDLYGFMGRYDTTAGLFRSAGCLIADKDEDDMPYLVFESTRNYEVVDKIFDIIYDDSFFCVHRNHLQNDEFRNMYAEGHGLFLWDTIEVVTYLRSAELPFGILPCPKYDETQENYLNMVSVHGCGLLSVPKTNSDLTRTGTILEALAAESSNTVQPAYYDINLYAKGVRDVESAAMLDILFDNRVYDLGDIYNFGDFSYQFLCISGSGTRDVASFWQKYEKPVTTALNKLLDLVAEDE